MAEGSDALGFEDKLVQQKLCFVRRVDWQELRRSKLYGGQIFLLCRLMA